MHLLQVRREIVGEVFHPDTGLLHSTSVEEFEEKWLDFEQRHGEKFHGNWLSVFKERLTKHVVEPAEAVDAINTDFKNNDCEVLVYIIVH